jgi:hypothetical protein
VEERRGGEGSGKRKERNLRTGGQEKRTEEGDGLEKEELAGLLEEEGHEEGVWVRGEEGREVLVRQRYGVRGAYA